MTTTPLSIAEQLRTAIRESGMSYRQLADKADVSNPLIAQFMTRPNKTITLESAEKLAKALGIKTLKVPT